MGVQTIDALLSVDSVAPAYVLSGPQGARWAQRFIQKLFCANSCNLCDHCVKLLNRTHPDVRWIRADGKNIKIDQVRQLQKQAVYPPHEAPLKIFVVEGAEYLSREASNSLLRILETPPPYLIFMLLTQRFGDLLPTVVSRCRIVRGGAEDLDETIHRACWGNPTWSETFPLDETPSPPPEQSPEALANAFDRNDLISLYRVTTSLFSALQAWTVAEVLRFSALFSRVERVKLEYGLHGLTFLCHEANLASSAAALDVLRDLSLSYGALQGNANQQLLVESTLLKLWRGWKPATAFQDV